MGKVPHLPNLSSSFFRSANFNLSLRKTESLRVAMSHAGQWLNTARRVLAHVRAYLDSRQYGERRDSEQACLANLSAWRYTY